MSKKVLGHSGLVWKGDYVAGTKYELLWLVKYNGGVYICKNPNGTTNNPSNTSDWALFVSSIINAVNGATTATSIYAATGSGTSGQYLKSNGANAAPTWSDISIDDGEIS